MKKTLNSSPALFIWILLICLLGSCSKSGSFSLTGKMEGIQDGDSLFLLVMPGDTLKTFAKDGAFVFKGHTDTIADALLVFGNPGPRTASITLFVEPGRFYIVGHPDSVQTLAITGTPNNDDLTRQKFSEQQLYAALPSIQDQLRDSTLKPDHRTVLQKEIAQIRERVRKGRIDFARTHPNSHAVPVYLRLLEDNLDLDTLVTLYEALSPDVKNTRFARGTSEKISARKRTSIGQPAPVFSAVTHMRDTIDLEDYRGKYVLLDFWASWCVPCRAEHPHLVEAYRKFGPAGFDIIGVSLDDNRERWIQAIGDDGLIWANVSELKGFEEPIARLYGVQPIPDNFLIDPEGVIVARGLRGGDLQKKIADLLGK